MLPGQGFGGSAGIQSQPGFVQMPYGKGPKMPGALNGKGLVGDVLSPQHPGSALREAASPQRAIIEGGALPPPEPTSGRLVLVTQDQHRKLPSPMPQGKHHMQAPVLPQATPVYPLVFPQGKEPKLGPKASPVSAPVRPPDESLKVASYEAGPAGETPAALPQGYGTGSYAAPLNGYGANAGKPQQSIYRQGGNLAGAGYVKGSFYPGVGQPEQQPAGFSPNGKNVPVYGASATEGLPYGEPAGMGAEKSGGKYGIGGLQFGANPPAAINGGYGIYSPAADVKPEKYGGANMGRGVPGQYGYGGLPNIGRLLGGGSNGHMAGKYGYGGSPHEVQPVGFVPQLKHPAAGQNGPGAPPHQSGFPGFEPNVYYGGAEDSYGPRGPVGEGKAAGKHVNGEDTANNKYENMGYISGSKLQPEVISLPASATPAPMGSDDLSSDLRVAGGLSFDSDAAGGSERPDDPERMPGQLHIRQHLKLHLHPQGSQNGNYDLNGFLGNSGYQGK
ncbi:collagen alpha-1(I) chain-like [Syngnathoides biaculeatus]|uniref:collagen alpha-1(I) chain-like n=1 Tax=Syngnathoides biaculeatus TaxID=300417 RepID=UPI002ADDDCAF|nr:collagen alpha-1(I) chain-like [Syngnathoides biaculeatus]